MSPRKDHTAATSFAHTPRRRLSKTAHDNQLAWTESVARCRPRAPVRRFSASEEVGFCEDAIQFQQPASVDDGQLGNRNGRDDKEVRFFGLPAPITPLFAGDSDLMDLSHEPGLPRFADGEISVDIRDQSMLLPQYQTHRAGESHQRTISIVTSDSEQPEPTFEEVFREACIMHALYQTQGGKFRNEFANQSVTEDDAAQTSRAKLKLTQRQRTWLEGHKAGLWLVDEDYGAFCKCANVLLLHQWHSFGKYPKGVKNEDLEKLDIHTDIKDGNKKLEHIKFKAYTEDGRRKFERYILPVLQRSGDQETRLFVHDGDLMCDMNCKRKKRYVDESPCDNSRDLEVETDDVGRLRVLADWHRWREQPKLVENSHVFEIAVLDMLFPLPDQGNEFYLELPDGQNFHIFRKASPALTAEVQEALSRITTSESHAGVQPQRIKLSPRRLSRQHVFGKPPESPSLARAEGTIFVYRPANITLFRYDVPHTMEHFLQLARRELYPDTPARLRLRISPSNAFRREGKLLLPIQESQGSYTKPDKNEETLEDIWKENIVDKWLVSHEDVWAIKVFEFLAGRLTLLHQKYVLVFYGPQDKDAYRNPERWDMSALGNKMSDDVNDEGWNIPSISLMDRLAEISVRLLNIDPRKPNQGVVLHVMREGPREWLRWKAYMSFNEWMLEILYKIDGELIAIYPGDYKEPDNLTGPEVDESEVVEAMKEAKRKKAVTAKAAVEAFTTPRPSEQPYYKNLPSPVRRLILYHPPDATFNSMGHMGVQLPQSTWNPEGTHLTREPSYAFNAPKYSESDMGRLAQRLLRAEEEILMREESCRVCGKVFLKRSGGKDLNMRDHLDLHPVVSDLRGNISVPLQISRRESATQTYDDIIFANEPRQPKSNDSMAELPRGEPELFCSKCHKYLIDYTEDEIEAHVEKCDTTIDDLTLFDIRKTWNRRNKIGILRGTKKPATRQARTRGLVKAAEAPVDSIQVLDQPASRPHGKRKGKADISKSPAGIGPGKAVDAPPKVSIAYNDIPTDNKAAKEARIASLVTNPQSSKAAESTQDKTIRARSEPPNNADTDEAPSAAQLRSSRTVNNASQGKTPQKASKSPSTKRGSDPGSSRKITSAGNVNNAEGKEVIPSPTKQWRKPATKTSEMNTKAADVTDAGDNPSRAANGKKTKETQDQEGETQQPKPRGRRPKTTEARDASTHPESIAPTAAATETQEPAKKRPGRKPQANDVKPEDKQNPENPRDAKETSKATRKPRAKKVQPENDPVPQHPAAGQAATKAPATTKRIRKTAAKKTAATQEKDQPESTDAQAAAVKTTATTSTAESPKKQKLTLKPPTKGEGPRQEGEPRPTLPTTAEEGGPSKETPAPEAQEQVADVHKGNEEPKVGKKGAKATATTTSPTKRKAPAKTATKVSAAKKRKPSPLEDETKTPAPPATAEQASSPLQSAVEGQANNGADIHVPAASPAKGKGKAKPPGPQSTTTISPTKRKAPTAKSTKTSPAKKRKPSPEAETLPLPTDGEGEHVVPSIEAPATEGAGEVAGAGQGEREREQAVGLETAGRGRRKRTATPKAAAAARGRKGEGEEKGKK
ncbi:MAG: hypothetical protein Q9166_003809 [cf. Caloplaca sp. 2 TL-2023]